MKNHSPRTQVAINAFADDESKLQGVFDLCRLLEMELEAFKRNNHELITSHNAMVDERDILRAEVDQWASRCAAAIWMLPQEVTGGQLKEAQDKFYRMLEKARKKGAAVSDDTSKLLKDCVEYRAMVDKLERENAALRAERVLVSVHTGKFTTISGRAMICPDCGMALLHEYRAAIDAARKEAQP